MRSGMIRQALRRNPWAFLGPGATQALAAALVTIGLCALASLDGAPLTAAQRATMTEQGVADIGVLFLVASIYLSILIVGVTMSTAIADQARDLALFRTVGATPARVRRAIAAQAALVAVPATIAGVPLGLLFGYWWVQGLVGHGIVPGEVTFRVHGGTVPIAFAVTIGTSLFGAMIAAIRPARLRPAVALAEAAAGSRSGRVRTPLGLLLVGGGLALSVVISGLDAETADNAGLFVMLAMCFGTGMLGPVLLRMAAPVARLFGPVGRVAADNVVARSRSLSGALVPLTLAVGFAAFTIVLGSTTEHVTGVAMTAADRWLTYAGTGVYALYAAIAAVNTLITVMQGRRRDPAVLRLVGATRGHTLRVVICEALVVTATALAAGSVVAAATLLPLLHTALGTWLPWVPPPFLAGGIIGTAALVVAGLALPAAAMLRHPPIEAIG
ncbi:ABC transporter permease [Actinoplanes sp. NPDC026619]|uniref:ABC transporter permease n=1 Tax=Actinoplanes sp. NPDC026619 TaxID=3155798 RepID=UPI0033D6F630